jgi:hypothetical protein
MLITCTTKGCLKQTEAKLDRDTKEVICEECGNAIQGVTPFMKKSLESVGQVLRHVARQAFMGACKQCNQNRQLYVKDDKAYCKHCSSQVHVTPAFLQGLKLHLAGEEKGAAGTLPQKKGK